VKRVPRPAVEGPFRQLDRGQGSDPVDSAGRDGAAVFADSVPHRDVVVVPLERLGEPELGPHLTEARVNVQERA
jgi:hypothetical protein